MPGPRSEIGLDDARVADVAALVRAELAREAEAGFPTLGRISSIGIIKFLDWCPTLSPADRGPLLDALSRLAALHFFKARPGAWLGVPKIRALYEATYFAGLRKAGMPEE